jgi:hypothetical protein
MLAGRLNPGHVFAGLGLIWAVFCCIQFCNPARLQVDRLPLVTPEIR